MQTPRAVPSFEEFWLSVEAKTAARGPVAAERLDDVRALLRLARELVRARKQKRLTQQGVSRATRIAQADISRYERGHGNPSFLTLTKLGRVYGRLTVAFGRAGARAARPR